MEKYISKEINDLLYLISCSLNSEAPDLALVQNMDLDAIYKLASFHSLVSMAAFALEKVLELPYQYDQSKKKAIRKLALFEIERNTIYSNFNREKIWYLPLKGIILKECYPRFGMREMSDNDILCDPSRIKDVDRIMKGLGYEYIESDNTIHNTYFKPPSISFELHFKLFSELEVKRIARYYSKIKNKLIQNENKEYEYSFSPEDFYIHIIAHEYKHFILGGTGLRSLVDIYVYLRKWKEKLNWNYINKELRALKLIEFEQLNRLLSEKVLNNIPLEYNEQKILYYIVTSGTYGTAEHFENNHFATRLSWDDSFFSKTRYIFRRIFISGGDLKEYYPFFDRHKYLLPILYIYRFVKGLFKKPKDIWLEYKRIIHFKIED